MMKGDPLPGRHIPGGSKLPYKAERFQVRWSDCIITAEAYRQVEVHAKPLPFPEFSLSPEKFSLRLRRCRSFGPCFEARGKRDSCDRTIRLRDICLGTEQSDKNHSISQLNMRCSYPMLATNGNSAI